MLENVIPYCNVEPKLDSAEKLAQVANKPTEHYLFAPEINLMVDKINQLKQALNALSTSAELDTNNQIVTLGEIGNLPIHQVVQNLDPARSIQANYLRIFKALRNGVIDNYLYTGPGGLVGLGNLQPQANEFYAISGNFLNGGEILVTDPTAFPNEVTTVLQIALDNLYAAIVNSGGGAVPVANLTHVVSLADLGISTWDELTPAIELAHIRSLNLPACQNYYFEFGDGDSTPKGSFHIKGSGFQGMDEVTFWENFFPGFDLVSLEVLLFTDTEIIANLSVNSNIPMDLLPGVGFGGYGITELLGIGTVSGNVYEVSLSNIGSSVGNINFDIPNIEELYLDSNELQTLPNWLANCMTLQKIHLTSNLFTDIPSELNSLPLLNSIDISNNKIQSIQSSFMLKATTIELRCKNNLIDTAGFLASTPWANTRPVFALPGTTLYFGGNPGITSPNTPELTAFVDALIVGSGATFDFSEL